MKQILIADDAVVFRQHAEGILRKPGFGFIHAADGAETVKRAVAHQPDLILLDVQMPILDGVQVLSFLSKHERTAHIPVIVITVAQNHDRKSLRRVGAHAVLQKPIQPAALSRCVRLFLGDVQKSARI